MFKMQLIIPTLPSLTARQNEMEPFFSSISCVCPLPQYPLHSTPNTPLPGQPNTLHSITRPGCNTVHVLLFYVICLCIYLFCYSMCSPTIYSDRQLSQHCQLDTLSGESECKSEGQNHEVLVHDRPSQKVWHM